jgi:tRNA (cytidine/uridine-2'-O-)-methyltransferase
MCNKFNKNLENGFERHVVLVSPEIHWNTGNIGRTCLATGAHLHLIKPLGFSLESREVKRAGLDYWNKVKLSVWDNFEDFKRKMEPQKDEVVVLTKKGEKPFWSMPICNRMFLVFGSETQGLSKKVLLMYKDSTFHIPINEDIRSLNLSTAAGIILYESLRHVNFNHFWA